MSRQSLNGRWQVRQTGPARRVQCAEWTPAQVPGCVHTDLLRARRIPAPHVGRNELDILWIDQADWEYRRTFRATVRQCAAAMQHLVFEGLDTAAEVLLNGRRVGRADNMFRRWRFDVAGPLRPGENELRVKFRSAMRYAEAMSRKSALPCDRRGTRHWPDRPPLVTYRPYVRKAQYQFGWDWGLMQVGCGIWQPCRLETADTPVLEYVTTQQRHARGRVTVAVTAHLLSPSKQKGTLRVRLGGRTVEVKASAAKGQSTVAAEVTVTNPHLWWPAGQGRQNLYTLEVAWVAEGAPTVADRYESRLGLRTTELISRKDKVGRSFGFRINGRDVYAKGANWIPDDVFPSRTTPERTERLLEDCVAANMNMLRVWGGGIYADDHFLRTCDRLGIMVWHDFMFACAAYPADRWFLDNVEAEMRHQMRRMANHPSIVLWCGNNENQEAIFVWRRGDPNHKALVRGYIKLTDGLQARVVAQEDPGRPWWPSSPSHGTSGPMETNFGDQDSGDMHYWGVWHRREPFSRYQELTPRFCSEFGFQSFPSVETLRTVAGPRDMNVTSPVMEHHQRSGIGNSVVTETLLREFRLPADFGDFCYLSQVNQALAMKTAIEHWRRIKPHCMGTLYWQLNDDWPVASWSSIDWHLRWKALHHAARRFYAPLLGSVTDDASGLSLWATSDVPEGLRGTWRVEAWTFAGRRVWSKRGTFRVKANESRAVAALPRKRILDLGGGEAGVFVVTQVRSGKHVSDNAHLFAPLKRADLPQARIAVGIRILRRARGADGAGFAIRLVSDAPAFHVELSTGRLRGRLSDNILTLLPRRPVTVRFTPARPTTAAALKKHLTVRTVRDTY